MYSFSYISQLEIQTGNRQPVVRIKGVNKRAQGDYRKEREEDKGQYPEKNDTEDT